MSESKLDDVARKYHLNSDEISFIREIDPDLKFQNRYVDWIAKHLRDRDSSPEQFPDGVDTDILFDLFSRFRQTGKKIEDFRSWTELWRFMDSKKGDARKKIYSGINKNDAEVIYQGDGVRIVWLKTFKGANLLYRGATDWCITKDEKFWNMYWNKSYIFVVFETQREAPEDYVAWMFKSYDPETHDLWDSGNEQDSLGAQSVFMDYEKYVNTSRLAGDPIYEHQMDLDAWFVSVNEFLHGNNLDAFEEIKSKIDDNSEYIIASDPDYNIKYTALTYAVNVRDEERFNENAKELVDLLMEPREGFVSATISNSIEGGIGGWNREKKADMSRFNKTIAKYVETKDPDFRKAESTSIYGMVLQESRLDKAVEKYNLNSDQRHFIYSIDPNSRLQNRYTEWLAKHVKELWETDTAEDIYQTLLMFQTMGRKISEFSSWKEVVEFVNSKRGMVRKNIYADKKRDYAEIVDGNSKYRLLWIKNFTGMHALYGGNADWCVANNEQFWDEYTRHGEKFFLVLECQKCDVWDENLVMMNSPYAILINPGDAENIDVLVQTYHVWDSNNSSNIDDPENDPVFSFNQDDMIAINDIMRKNREKIMKIAKKVSMRESASVYGMLLQEGRAGGHIHHPHEFVRTGAELISLFKRLAVNFSDPQYLKQHVSLKVDGVNAVFKLVHRNGGVQWAFDGGSGKGEDVRGVATDELDARFGEHRPIYFQAINTLNRMLPYIGSNLRELGLEAENQKGLMCDINMPGTTNVVDYATQFPFLTIHDVVHMQDKPESKRGAREAVEVPVDATLLKKTVNLMDGLAQKRGWRIFGGVGVVLATETLDVSVPLKRKISIGNETKALEKWIEGITIDHKQVNLKNYTKMLHHEQMTAPEHEGALIFLANMLCGQHILNSLKSAVLSPSEGIVIRDSQIANGKMKITGNFMVNRSKSPFNKKELK